jgi:O-antigen/teichoic acid export membrane protein
MWYFAIVLLGFYKPGTELGWFGASHRVSMALHTFVWLYFFNLLPYMSRCVGRPHSMLLNMMDQSMAFSAWSGVFIGLVTTLLSRELLTAAYGPRFAGGGPTLTALGWMIPIAMLSGHHRFALIAYNRQITMMYSAIGSGVIAVILAFELIPRYGAMGAAYSLLAANISNLIFVYIAVRKTIVNIPVSSYTLKALGGFAAAMAVASLTHSAGPWMSGLCAAATYAVILAVVERNRGIALVRHAMRADRTREMEEVWAGRGA